MPAKGQSQIIQFILFFMIGLSIFISVGGVFRDRVDFFAEDISEANRRMVSGYFSALAVQELATCKQCDSVNISTRLVNTTAGSVTKLELAGSEMTVTSLPDAVQYSASAHNLLLDLAGIGGSALSGRPIVLSYSKNQNRLEVYQ